MKKTNTLRKFWYGLSVEQRNFIRRAYYFPKDFWDGATGKRHKYIPPRGFIYTGSPAKAEDYFNQGLHQLELLKAYADLKPTHRVLDIGSGIGRSAIALTTYLNDEGEYQGFDVVKKGVDWCNKTIHKDFPNFHFTYVPLFNDLYNHAEMKATEFEFPYPDDFFQVIFSFSVFTHMQVPEIAHYLKESSHVLTSEGIILNTFFTYNSETENHIANLENFAFPVKKEGYRLMSSKVTAGNIALDENKLKEISEEAGLELVQLIDGFWKNPAQRKEGQEYQDIAIFKRKPTP